MEQTHNRIDLLNMLACGLTASRLMASQTAVLTTIARFPGIQSGGICSHTRLSSSNVGRLLDYLSSTGDIVYSAMPGSGKGRKWFITAGGVQTINRLYCFIAPRKGAKFTIQEYRPDSLFDL
ncbi:winged helix-turn-helix transcriptional regulator [Akkermansia glycaniphila]|uniref:MarR family winged helix-turn-helix transcriptional regulator n=1 Tax=Akkermansia glycaniphila TaxID=1679444 RepID=UPI001C02A589|nr:MarR family winged helix-turn-helix transcriptional regulator [Akkermansia glycaniphila]MBT9449980.1 winged helix-turn-helix transcriptional regulator [Akkermansia glycaniphila]